MAETGHSQVSPPSFDLQRPVPLETALMNAELERAYVAEVIHDDVLQLLGACLMAAETCEQATALGRTETLPRQLGSVRELLEQSVAQLRDLMADLRTYEPAGAGIEGALERSLRGYQQRNGGTASLQLDGSADLQKSVQSVAYRFILETLRSVRSQGLPSDVRITLSPRPDGIGLDVLVHPTTDGVSGSDAMIAKRLALLRWRVQALGGSLEQESIPPSDLRLRIRLPLV